MERWGAGQQNSGRERNREEDGGVERLWRGRARPDGRRELARPSWRRWEGRAMGSSSGRREGKGVGMQEKPARGERIVKKNEVLMGGVCRITDKEVSRRWIFLQELSGGRKRKIRDELIRTSGKTPPHERQPDISFLFAALGDKHPVQKTPRK